MTYACVYSDVHNMHSHKYEPLIDWTSMKFGMESWHSNAVIAGPLDELRWRWSASPSCVKALSKLTVCGMQSASYEISAWDISIQYKYGIHKFMRKCVHTGTICIHLLNTSGCTQLLYPGYACWTILRACASLFLQPLMRHSWGILDEFGSRYRTIPSMYQIVSTGCWPHHR